MLYTITIIWGSSPLIYSSELTSVWDNFFFLLTPGRVCRHFKSIQYCWEIPIAVIPKCHLLGNTCSIFGGICCNTCTLKQKRTFLVAVPPVGVYTNIKKESVSLRSAQNTQISEQTGWDSKGLSGDRRSNSIFNNAEFFLGFWRHLLNKGHAFYYQRSSRMVIAEPKDSYWWTSTQSSFKVYKTH